MQESLAFQRLRSKEAFLKVVNLVFFLLMTVNLVVFYILVSTLERDLREFIKAKIGKGWDKRIEIEVPSVFKRWQDKRKKDENWGIDIEDDLLNYADLEDYIEMIKKFNRIFVDTDRQLSNVITYLEIWYKYGRNPLMHSRTVTRQKYETTKSAIDFLRKWMTG